MVPVGQGALPPWPTTFVAHNRLRRDYLRTMSQLAAIASSGGGAYPALNRLAAAVTPDRALPVQDSDLPISPCDWRTPDLLTTGLLHDGPNSGRQRCSR